jgi:hypothetical protein
MTGRRWDTDERGTGVADATIAAPSLARLLAMVREPAWVAEDPELHLLPHLMPAAERLGLMVTVIDGSAGGLEIAVTTMDAASRREVRARIHGLVGSIAESSTHVREVESGRVYEVVTGMLEGDGPFAPHGHILRIVVTGDDPRPADAGRTDTGKAL